MKLTFDTIKDLVNPLGYEIQEDHPTIFMDGSHICAITLDIPYVQEHFHWDTTKLSFPSIDPSAFVTWMNKQKYKDDLLLYNGASCYHAMFLYNLFKAFIPFKITQFTLEHLTGCDLNTPLFLHFKTLLLALAPRVDENNPNEPLVFDQKTMHDIRTKKYDWQVIPSTKLSRYQ